MSPEINPVFEPGKYSHYLKQFLDEYREMHSRGVSLNSHHPEGSTALSCLNTVLRSSVEPEYLLDIINTLENFFSDGFTDYSTRDRDVLKSLVEQYPMSSFFWLGAKALINKAREGYMYDLEISPSTYVGEFYEGAEMAIDVLLEELPPQEQYMTMIHLREVREEKLNRLRNPQILSQIENNQLWGALTSKRIDEIIKDLDTMFRGLDYETAVIMSNNISLARIFKRFFRVDSDEAWGVLLVLNALKEVDDELDEHLETPDVNFMTFLAES